VRRVLYDTNVVLDVLQARHTHLAASAAALDLVEAGRVEGYVAAHAVTTIAYLLQRQVGAARSRAILADLLSRLQVAAVTERTIRTALAGEFRDFEDAVCHAAALEAGAELIVTRNLADFAAGTVPAVLPETLLATMAG
jgi:predicted nucleic acid-binding protein